MWFVQALDVLVAVTCQAKLNLVLAVLYEGVREDRPAASTDRQTLDMFFLREVGPDPNRLAARGTTGSPIAIRLIFCAAVTYRSRSVGDRSPTVMLSNPRLDSSFGKSERHRHHRKQVADRVLVFAPIEPAEGFGPPGIGMNRSRAVERVG